MRPEAAEVDARGFEAIHLVALDGEARGPQGFDELVMTYAIGGASEPPHRVPKRGWKAQERKRVAVCPPAVMGAEVDTMNRNTIWME